LQQVALELKETAQSRLRIRTPLLAAPKPREGGSAFSASHILTRERGFTGCEELSWADFG
jgi:hypothetical protein